MDADNVHYFKIKMEKLIKLYILCGITDNEFKYQGLHRHQWMVLKPKLIGHIK